MEVLSSGKRLINDGATAVTEALTALVLRNSEVALMDYGRVIVRRDYENIKGVKIISGGGSGHEPAHSGFVGKGMLTAAVQGDIFKAPPAIDVLRTIKELSRNSDYGVLLIIQNISGERFNFGLALERARNANLRVKMLVVSDDCCVLGPYKEKRGLSGVILMHKIAGAMADEGKNIDEIYNYCRKLHQEMSSILMCLKPCTTTSIDTCICVKHFKEDTYEIGSGLHGENGIKTLAYANVKDVCLTLIGEMTDPASENSISLDPHQPIVLLVNNLGSTSKLEELVFLKEFVQQLYEIQIPIARIYCGTFMTILDTVGLSVTVLKVTDENLLHYLDYPVGAPAWEKVEGVNLNPELEKRIICKMKRKSKTTDRNKGPKLSEVQSNIMDLVIRFACNALISCEKQLNTIDAEMGNADTGTYLRKGAEAILRELNNKKLTTYYPFTVFQSLSKILEVTMGGTLGCIYSIFFEAGARVISYLDENHTLTPHNWLSALKCANRAVKSYTNVEAGDGTMFDALYTCAVFFEEALKDSKGIEALGRAVAATEEAAMKTKVSNRKYPDAGAHAVGIWMRAVFEGVKLRCSDDDDDN